MFDLARAMNTQAQEQDFSKKIMVEPHSDASLIATYYNHVTQAFNQLNAEKEALIEETFHMANYDQLTGLAKRRLLVNELSRSLERLNRQPQMNALLFIDLDGFKLINDEYGHDAGDILLKEAALRIQSVIRKTDLAARFGGDEFVVLLDNIQNESFAAEVTDKIINAVKQPISLPNNEEGFVNASIGLKIFDQEIRLSVDDILNQADKAMYVAKRRGKGQWVLA
jgi:Amt family ammonium transporter